MYFTGNAGEPLPVVYVMRFDNQDWFREALLAAIASLARPSNWQQEGDVSPAKAATFGAYALQYFDLGVDMIGMIMPFSGHASDIPDGALLCNGAELDTEIYPRLATVLGWSGDPDERIGLPDLRASFLVGVNSATEGGLKPVVQGYAVGAHGSSEFRTLSVGQLPAHSHADAGHTHVDTGHTHGYVPALPSVQEVTVGVPAPAAIPGASATAPGFANIASGSANIQDTGGGEQIDIRPPFYALCYAVIAVWGGQ
jgi:microcystin-dependent protein